MIALGPEGSGKLYEEIMKWKQKPMNGVMLEEAYQIFGEWDFAILFQADTNENALHFVGDRVRPIEGVATTFTLPIAPVKDYRKPKKKDQPTIILEPCFFMVDVEVCRCTMIC